MVIENVTGAAGSTGTGRIARAAPDGYNILYGANVTHVLNPAVLTLNYDVVNDFEPIVLIGNTPWLFAVKNDLPVNDLKELIVWLKANPDKATFGTAGVGSPSHIGGVLFQNVTGTSFQFIPYRGTAPVIPDLVSGQIDMSILDPITSLPQFRGGKIKILAAMAKQRSAGAPTFRPATRPAYPASRSSPGRAMWAPKGTPKDVIAKLNAAVVSALSDRGDPQAVCRPELRAHPARAADAGVSGPVPQGRDGEVVADHQGGRHQGRVRAAARNRGMTTARRLSS